MIRVAFDTLGQKQRVLEPYSLSLPWILKGKIHSAIDGKAGRSVSFNHLVFFVKNIIQAAENLEARGKIEGYGGVKEGITGQSQ